jgi:hypothetical protein
MIFRQELLDAAVLVKIPVGRTNLGSSSPSFGNIKFRSWKLVILSLEEPISKFELQEDLLDYIFFFELYMWNEELRYG